MRWTKGKPAATAPLNTPVLFGHGSGDGYRGGFAVGVREEQTTWYNGTHPVTKSLFYTHPRRVELDATPDRWWPLPPVQPKRNR